METKERIERLANNRSLLGTPISNDSDALEEIGFRFDRYGEMDGRTLRLIRHLEERYIDEDSDYHKHIQSDIFKRLVKMSEVVQEGWNKGFIESLTIQCANSGPTELSEKQIAVLANIETQHSPEYITANQRWAKEYSPTKKKIAKVCAQYYMSNPPYFGDLAAKILGSDDFVPTRKQWMSMCENKFAKRVVKSTFSEPKYPIKSMVAPRSTAPWDLKKNFKRGFVLDTDTAPVTSAAAGSKRYLVLPVGEMKPIDVEERYLKKDKKR